MWREAPLLLIALCVVGLVVMVAGLLAGLEESRTRLALDAAGRENQSLRVRQDILREHTFDLAGRLEEIEYERAVFRVVTGKALAPVPAPARR